MKNSKLALSMLAVSIVSILFTGCDSSSSSNNGELGDTMPTTRFMSMSMMDQDIMQDTNTSLEWVNGTKVAGVATGCLPVVPGSDVDEINAIALNHCDNLMFAGHSDWRVPSIMEVQEFTVEMQKAAMTPFYANPACPRLVGLDTNNTIETINTHNTDPIGMINPWTNLNAGVRCVRAF